MTSKFAKGSGTYRCSECGKLTRETGEGESFAGVCRKCWDEGGLINAHDDGQHKVFNPDCPVCIAEQAKQEANNVRK